MNLPHFQTCLDELFEVEEGTIQPETVVQEIDGWSSLTFMGLIALVDEEFEVTLSPATVLAATTVTDLWTAIEHTRTGEAAA